MTQYLYLLRLDDACPTMDVQKWSRIESILDKYGIKPMVGIIPNNKDSKQILSNPDPEFWNKVKVWESKGWAIALHGYDHCYISNEAGINPLWNRSEFAGVPLEKQKEKISKGIAVFHEHGIDPKYFFAPSHTFDLNTLEALRQCSQIRIISDTIATKPYNKWGFVFIPQMGGRPKTMRVEPLMRTICLHPSTMKDADFAELEQFLSLHKDKLIGFNDLNLENVGSKNFISRLISLTYFSYRKLRGIK